MILKNTKSAFGAVAIALHWISAVGVIWLYFLGENIEHAKKDGLPREEIIAAINFHMSIGLLFFAFLAARVISSLTQPKPGPVGGHRYLNLLSLFVQRLWLAMISIQLITGPLLAWTAARPNKIFDWLVIPSPFPERVNWLHEGLEIVHAYAPNVFWPLLVLHVVGAAKHLFVDKDGLVERMVIPGRTAGPQR